ncbi:MAG: sulfur oxidation c-type cytochrome SoxX [Halothiobacillaceae bacterium]|jgi:sulfur-oxidizing protein SoxX
MRKIDRILAASVSAAALMGALAVATPAMAQENGEKKEMTGKELAFNNSKGNCLACHMIAGGDQPGTIGPPLIAMKQRYPDRKALYDVIYDPRTKFGPHTIMPPIGAHGILSKDELEKVVDFIHSL